MRTTKGALPLLFGGLFIACPQLLAQQYTYHDGKRAVRVTLQPSLAVERDATGNVQFVEHAERADNEQPVTAVAPTVVSKHPVFTDASGNQMALSGEVILLLDPEWTRARVASFLADHDIADAAEPVPWSANTFLVRAGPGLASLELANALIEELGVSIAMPNWWIDMRVQ